MTRAAALLLVVLTAMSVLPAFAEGPGGGGILLAGYWWGTASQPARVRPGYTDFPLTVEVIALPNSTVQFAELLLYGPISSSTGSVSYAAPQVSAVGVGVSNVSLAGLTLPVASSGTSTSTFTFLLDVSQSAGSSSYPALLLVNYTRSGKMQQEAFPLSLRVYPPERLSLGEASWGSSSSSSPVYPYPGFGLVPLTAYVFNSAQTAVLGGNVTLSLPPGLTGPGGSGTAAATFGYLPPGGAQELAFQVNVTSSAEVGSLLVPARVAFEDAQGGSYALQTYLSISVYPRAQLRAEAVSSPSRQGEMTTVLLRVSNSGTSPLSEVSVQPELGPMELVGSNSSVLPYLGAGKTATFYYRLFVPAVQPGVYPLYFSVVSAQGGQATAFAPLAVEEQGQPLTVSLSPSQLNYDRNNTVQLLVQASQPVRGLDVSLTPVQGIYVSQGFGPWHLGDLREGQVERLNLSLVPELPPGPLPLQLTLSFLGSQNYTRVQQVYLVVLLRGEVQLNFSDVTTSPAYNGSLATVSGTIIDTGTEEAHYVTVWVGSNSTYVGDLPTDSPTPFSLSFAVPANASGTYRQTLTVTYQNSLGQEHGVSIPVSVPIEIPKPKASPSGTSPTTYAALAAVVELVVLAFFASRRFTKKRGEPGKSPGEDEEDGEAPAKAAREGAEELGMAAGAARTAGAAGRAEQAG
ncbi:MAG: NEW3 domain-containing protein [Conexivisphaerales archaeon]|nr:NEW3 domain-containing protein [Conexivisphaerales archaeon]